MSNSLREKLLGLGFAAPARPKPERKPDARRAATVARAATAPRRPRTGPASR